MQPAALGLELKERWCKKLLQGEKKLELRRYAIPEEFLDQPVYLLSTPDGHEGQSTLPPETMPAAHPGVCIAGTVTFSGQVVYSSYEQWLGDVTLHCVEPGTPYSWQPGITKEMFGWRIASVQAAAAPQPVPAMRRVLSSWFKVLEVQGAE
uniref:ASCH domain-containing protein n=1 Tax=Tetradesmus obliquus TaxID=3088 RepID=A0A383W6F9_TETOB|eukprot:jgi/Sobl393_1/4436/SZX72604.1